uniref:Uncharacterized protein n=1 Tax=Cannabis sativa TaxID=3483 RepID=A0A803P608_CANSA
MMKVVNVQPIVNRGRCISLSEASISLVLRASTTQVLSKFYFIGKVLFSKLIEEREVVDRKWVLDNGPCRIDQRRNLSASSLAFFLCEDRWVQIKYEKLGNFCYLYRCLGQRGKLNVSSNWAKDKKGNKGVRKESKMDGLSSLEPLGGILSFNKVASGIHAHGLRKGPMLKATNCSCYRTSKVWVPKPLFTVLSRFSNGVHGLDMPIKGGNLTWDNHRDGSTHIKSALDKALVNEDWLQIFPKVVAWRTRDPRSPLVLDHAWALVFHDWVPDYGSCLFASSKVVGSLVWSLPLDDWVKFRCDVKVGCESMCVVALARDHT